MIRWLGARWQCWLIWQRYNYISHTRVSGRLLCTRAQPLQYGVSRLAGVDAARGLGLVGCYGVFRAAAQAGTELPLPQGAYKAPIAVFISTCPASLLVQEVRS